MSFRYATIAAFIAIVLMFFALHSNFIGLDNGGTAHGQQGANLALAQGFVDNDLNFLAPQTNALNSASNDFETIPLKADKRTAAHFPIHSYFPALIHKVTGQDLASSYHWYNILWGYFGLFILYLLSLRITQNIGKSLFILIFFGTAPLFAFYQSTVQPEIPSIALLLAGTYFIYRFTQWSRLKHAWLGLFALLLAALSSPDSLLFLLSGIGIIIYQLYRSSQLGVKNLIAPIIALIAFALNEWHFYTIRADFGSQFPGLFQDWTYDQTTANFIFSNWKMHYFTVFQTAAAGVILILLFFSKFRKTESRSNLLKRYRIILITLPALIFALISPFQLLYSDVFFLKTFFLIIVLTAIFMVDRFDLGLFYTYPKIGITLFLFVIGMLIGEGNWTQTVRHEKARTSPGAETAFQFKGGNELLISHGVQNDALINIVIPNGSGIGFDVLANLNHSGIISEPPPRTPGARFPKGHYVVCTLEERKFLYAHFQTKFKELGDNGSIVLFKAID